MNILALGLATAVALVLVAAIILWVTRGGEDL